jgi:hypothetical protein
MHGLCKRLMEYIIVSDRMEAAHGQLAILLATNEMISFVLVVPSMEYMQIYLILHLSSATPLYLHLYTTAPLQLRTYAIPQLCNSTLLQFRNSAIPHFCTSALLHFCTSALLQLCTFATLHLHLYTFTPATFFNVASQQISSRKTTQHGSPITTNWRSELST